MWQTLASICCTYLFMYYSPAYFKVWIFDKYDDDLDSKTTFFCTCLMIG